MLDTQVGRSKKGDAADVARVGFDPMMRDDGDVCSGGTNKLQSSIANVTPAGLLPEQHRRMAEPGSVKKPGRRPPALASVESFQNWGIPRDRLEGVARGYL
jgi:hypothetical protein